MSFRTNRRTRKKFPIREKSEPVEEDEREYMMYPKEEEEKEYDFIDDEYPSDRIGDI